jgi:organic radical activating enzyme
MTAIEVSDLFTSIQGEGRHAHRPSVFLRFRRCNLACVWCDTKYTWDETDEGYNSFTSYENVLALAEDLELAQARGVSEELQGQIRDSLGDPAAFISGTTVSHLVITGGEPMIWKSTIAELLPLIPSFRTIEIETNGTIPPMTNDLNDPYNVTYNVSPKLYHSGNEGAAAVNPDVWGDFARTRRAYWKIVISGQDATEPHHVHADGRDG